MKKLGLLTLHYGYNEGAILQSLCLAGNLKKRLAGWDVDIIDQRYPGKLRAVYNDNGERELGLQSFIDKELPLSENRFIEDSHKHAFEYINKEYGAVIVGSDEVWKVDYNNYLFGLFFSQKNPWCPPFPNVYWPGVEVKVPKIAFAASIGSINCGKIPKSELARMKEKLLTFRLLGVRDQRTRDFLGHLDPKLGEKAELVPDPTFFLESINLTDANGLKSKLISAGVDFSRPRALVISPEFKYSRLIADSFKRKDFQVISLTFKNRSADVDLSGFYLNPLEWFTVTSLADIVVSMRMHGCISAILSKKPVLALDPAGVNKGLSKIGEIMDYFGLRDLCYDLRENSSARLSHLCDTLTKKSLGFFDNEPKISALRTRLNVFTDKIKSILLPDERIY